MNHVGRQARRRRRVGEMGEVDGRSPAPEGVEDAPLEGKGETPVLLRREQERGGLEQLHRRRPAVELVPEPRRHRIGQ